MISIDINKSVSQFFRNFGHLEPKQLTDKIIERYSEKLDELYLQEEILKDRAKDIIDSRTKTHLEKMDMLESALQIRLDRYKPLFELQDAIFTRFIKGGCSADKAAYSTAMIISGSKTAQEIREYIKIEGGE